MAIGGKYMMHMKDFEKTVNKSWKELQDEKDFYDVTLSCDGGQIEAHKLIVSSCSPSLREILRKNPHQHPLIYLKGVKYSDMVNIVDFMYQGVVKVAQNHLNDFLELARELKVKGISDQKNKRSKDHQVDHGSPSVPQKETVPPDNIKSDKYKNSEDKMKLSNEAKTEVPISANVDTNKSLKLDDKDKMNIHIDETGKIKLTNDNKLQFSCEKCAKVLTSSSNFYSHVLAFHNANNVNYRSLCSYWKLHKDRIRD